MIRREVLEIENILVNKLKQKTNFTKREIKKFFLDCDINRNGLISLSKLKCEILKYLPGVNEQHVEELIQYYNIHNDDFITFDDFFSFLENCEIRKNNRGQMNDRTRTQQNLNITTNSNPLLKLSELNEIDSRNLAKLHAQIKTYVHNLKLHFIREASTLRKNNQIKNHLIIHGNELLISTGRELLLRSFQYFDEERITLRNFIS